MEIFFWAENTFFGCDFLYLYLRIVNMFIIIYPLVNIQKADEKITMLCSWVNPRTFYGHVQYKSGPQDI